MISLRNLPEPFMVLNLRHYLASINIHFNTAHNMALYEGVTNHNVFRLAIVRFYF